MEGLREAVERLPSRESLSLKKAIQLYDTRKLPKALKTVSKVLDSLPEHPESLCVKAIVLQAMGNLKEALGLAEGALRKNLANVMCWHTLGILKQADRQNKEALKYLTQAYNRSPDNHIIQRDLSLLQLQLRQYESFRQLRLKALLIRSSQGISWVSYAVAEFLCGNHQKTVEVLDSLLRSLGAQLSPVETSEVMMFRGHVLEVAGKTQEAVSYLCEHERQILDKVGLKESQAKLYLQLQQFANAADTIYSLLEMNPESRDYHKMLEAVSSASGIPPTDVYGELAEKYPKSHLVERIPLNFTSGPRFEQLLTPYIAKRIRNGIPSLCEDLKSLYSDPAKVTIIEKVINEMIALMKSERKITPDSDTKEAPNALMWLYYLQAAHFKAVQQFDAAIDSITSAINHTPTVPDLYVMKGRILKHMQQTEAAASVVEEGRNLDLADRYLNNKAAKFFLRANNTAKAEELMAMFSREQGVINVHEMQNMWYELENAEAHERLQHWSQAAEEFKFVEKQFADIYEDQSDFHMYCFRKMTLMSYVKVLKFEDELYGQKRFCRAACGLLRCFLADRSTLEQTKATSLALQLLQFHSHNADALGLCVQVFMDAGRILMVVKCLFKLKKLGGEVFERYRKMTTECPAFDVSKLPASAQAACSLLLPQLQSSP